MKRKLSKAAVDRTVSLEQKLSWKALFLPIVMLLALAAYPALFLVFQNADTATLSEAALPLLLSTGAALVLFFVLLAVMGHPAKSALGAALVMLLLLNYALLEKGVRMLLPTAYYWHILPTFLVLAVCALAVIKQKLPVSVADMVNKILCLVFAVLILLNGMMAVPTIIKRIQMERETADRTANLSVTDSGSMPNIYYLIFDEYSSVDFMKKYYNYDNSAFTDYLEKLGFTVSYTSHNESPMTSTVTTNLVNLDYVVDDTWSELEKKERKIDNVLFPLLREHGYTVIGAAGAESYGLMNMITKSTIGTSVTMGGETVSDLILKNTCLYPLLMQDSTQIMEELNWIKNPDNYAQSNQFTMFHINLPHPPFIYGRNGRVNANITEDWHDTEYYLGQYIFTTSQMIEIADLITTHDPNSIIFMTSDHSARASTDVSALAQLRITPEDMRICFNAVYYRGEPLYIEGLSAVNTLRSVLNSLLGTDFKIVSLPDTADSRQGSDGYEG